MESRKIPRIEYNGETWTYLDEGQYNVAYLSPDKKSVLKIPKDPSDESEKPLRAVRLWNQINPDLSPEAQVVRINDEIYGWICPFVQGFPAYDYQIIEKIIDIYNRTGRIVIDAMVEGNVLYDITNKKVECIDISMALQLDENDRKIAGQELRKSEVSLQTWSDLKNIYNQKAFLNPNYSDDAVINTLKALLFLQVHRPDICN